MTDSAGQHRGQSPGGQQGSQTKTQMATKKLPLTVLSSGRRLHAPHQRGASSPLPRCAAVLLPPRRDRYVGHFSIQAPTKAERQGRAGALPANLPPLKASSISV